jgi:hypothetical protein
LGVLSSLREEAEVTLQEFIDRNRIRTVIHNHKDMKILFME